MDEIDALGRQMLLERQPLTKGRLSVYRESKTDDDWFPKLNVTLKKTGSNQILWQWTTHKEPIDFDEPPPYGEDLLLEKYFELEAPIKSPRGLEAVFSLTRGATSRGRVDKFSAALYLYPGTFEDRGVQVAVIDCTQGLTASSLPLFFRTAFPW
jgi:hypothetical protein